MRQKWRISNRSDTFFLFLSLFLSFSVSEDGTEALHSRPAACVSVRTALLRIKETHLNNFLTFQSLVVVVPLLPLLLSFLIFIQSASISRRRRPEG